jgi:hypothetical protein
MNDNNEESEFNPEYDAEFYENKEYEDFWKDKDFDEEMGKLFKKPQMVRNNNGEIFWFGSKEKIEEEKAKIVEQFNKIMENEDAKMFKFEPKVNSKKNGNKTEINLNVKFGIDLGRLELRLHSMADTIDDLLDDIYAIKRNINED